MINKCALRRFCKGDYTKIENYETALNDNTQTWHLHHREELWPNGRIKHWKHNLILMNMYYDRPPEELIFLKKSEHISLHAKSSDWNCSCTEKTRKKMSETWKNNEKYKNTKHHQLDSLEEYRAYQREYHREYYKKNKDKIKAAVKKSKLNAVIRQYALLEIEYKKFIEETGSDISIQEYVYNALKPKKNKKSKKTVDTKEV